MSELSTFLVMGGSPFPKFNSLNGVSFLLTTVRPYGGHCWSVTGHRFYHSENNNRIIENRVTVPFQVAGGVNVDYTRSSRTMGAATGTVRGIEISEDGTLLQWIDSNGYVYQTVLSTPFNINTASGDTRITAIPDVNGQQIQWSPNGQYLFVKRFAKIYRLEFSTPFDLTSFITDSHIGQEKDIPSFMPQGAGVVSEDGKYLIAFLATVNEFWKMDFGTPWDVTTIDYDGRTLIPYSGATISDTSNSGTGLSIKGNKMLWSKYQWNPNQARIITIDE